MNCETNLVKKLYNFYSSQECVHGIFENETGVMQIHPQMGLVEVLDESGKRIDKGLGRVVVTGFMRKSMPLIRYDIGDLIEADHYKIVNGINPQWPAVGSIFGRAEDLVYKRDGSRIGYLCFHATKNIPEITEAQIVQESFDAFVCNLVVHDVESRKQVEEKVIAEISKRLGTPVKIDFRYIDFIPRGKNEKFKAVVVNFKPETL
jgi:phenylacetate-CoA ligase